MNPFILELVGAVVRFGLVNLSWWLTSHEVLTAAQGDRLTSEGVAQAVAWTPWVAAFVWSIWATYWKRKKLNTAYDLPHRTDEAEVKQKIAQGQGCPVLGLRT